MTSRGTRIRRSLTRSVFAVGTGVGVSYLLDPASGRSRRSAVREGLLGLIPGSIHGRVCDEVAPGPPMGGQDPAHEGQGDPTGGAAFVQLVERR